MQRRKSRKKCRTTSRGNIKEKEKLKLWVRAGGRCEFPGCNKYLLEDEFTGFEESLEEIAHIVAKSKNGPRGDSPLPKQDRNKADNYLLLCTEHHRKIIDRKELLREFPTSRLREYKKEHEERIRHLTSLGPEAETVVICMTGNIRGHATSISGEEIRKAVWENARRYPKYLKVRNCIEIDLAGLSSKIDNNYWESGKTKLDDVYNREILPTIKEAQHLSVFAIARIPFLIYLGWLIGDKIPTDIYQKHRDGNEGWIWGKSGQCVNFECKKIKSNTDKLKVALVLSISGKIKINDLPHNIRNSFTIYEIAPVNVAANRSILSLKGSFDNFRDIYQKHLRFIEKNHKDAKNIHLFPAVPNSIAVACGKELLRDVSPSLLVYDKKENGYNFTMEVK